MEIIDISVPIEEGMIVYEGDPKVRLVRVAAITSGDIANVSRLEMGVHTGTHVDAPVHFFDGAKGAEAISLDALIGPAYVVDATRVDGNIDATALRSLAIAGDATRVLFKTRNGELWASERFTREFAGITAEAAAGLVARGVRLVGIDYLSVAPYADPRPTHETLLRAGVAVLEGLDLRQVEPGAYRLICLPLLIPGSDGAPARAVLVRE